MKFDHLRKRVEKLEARLLPAPSSDLEPGSREWWDDLGRTVKAALAGERVEMSIDKFRAIVAIAKGELPIPDWSTEPDSTGATRV